MSAPELIEASPELRQAQMAESLATVASFDYEALAAGSLWEAIKSLSIKASVAKLVNDASTMATLDRIARLEDRLAHIEAGGTLELRGWAGIWRQGLHERGCIATDKGALWVCHEATRERPGASAAWSMIVKSKAR